MSVLCPILIGGLKQVCQISSVSTVCVCCLSNMAFIMDGILFLALVTLTSAQLYIDQSEPYEFGDLPYSTINLRNITPPELPVTEGQRSRSSSFCQFHSKV